MASGSGFVLFIGNKRNWAKWLENVVKIFPVITSFAASVESILCITVFDRGVARVGDIMYGIDEQE